MIQPRQQKQGGFVITVELLMIFTIIIIATLVALAAVRNALVDAGIVIRPTFVADSTGEIVGKVFDFDDSETPRVRRFDPNNGLMYLIGIRRDRFVSHTPVFYSGAGCTGVPYVAAPGFEGPAPTSASDDPALTGAVERLAGRVGHFNRMRPDPADAGDTRPVIYAVGFAPTTVVAGTSPYGTGLLYRHRSASTAAAFSVASVFVSSWDHTDAASGDVDPLNPCRSLVDILTGLVPAEEVADPTTSSNVLLAYAAPFQSR